MNTARRAMPALTAATPCRQCETKSSQGSPNTPQVENRTLAVNWFQQESKLWTWWSAQWLPRRRELPSSHTIATWNLRKTKMINRYTTEQLSMRQKERGWRISKQSSHASYASGALRFNRLQEVWGSEREQHIQKFRQTQYSYHFCHHSRLVLHRSLQARCKENHIGLVFLKEGWRPRRQRWGAAASLKFRRYLLGKYLNSSKPAILTMNPEAIWRWGSKLYLCASPQAEWA